MLRSRQPFCLRRQAQPHPQQFLTSLRDQKGCNLRKYQKQRCLCPLNTAQEFCWLSVGKHSLFPTRQTSQRPTLQESNRLLELPAGLVQLRCKRHSWSFPHPHIELDRTAGHSALRPLEGLIFVIQMSSYQTSHQPYEQSKVHALSQRIKANLKLDQRLQAQFFHQGFLLWHSADQSTLTWCLSMWSRKLP